MIFYTQSLHIALLKRIFVTSMIIMISLPSSVFSNAEDQPEQSTQGTQESLPHKQDTTEPSNNNQESNETGSANENSELSDMFANLSPEQQMALLLQMLESYKGQNTTSSKVLEFKDSKDPAYHQLLLSFILAHTAWRMYYDYHKFDKTVYSSGKIKEAVGSKQRFIQKNIFPYFSGFLGLWHTVDALVKDKKLDFDPLESKENFQKGVLFLLTNPNFLRHLQAKTAFAHRYERYFEDEWPLPLRFALLALPGIAYHYWKGKSDQGGYPTYTKDNSTGKELPGCSSHEFVTFWMLKPSPECHCDEKHAYTSKVLYEQETKKWWIPWHHITRRQAKVNEYNKLIEEGNDEYRVRTISSDIAHRSHQWQDAPLLRYAYRRSFDMLLRYLYYDKGHVEAKLTSKIGPEKVAALYEKTFGAVHPDLLFTVVESLAHIFLYEVATRYKESEKSLVPHFDKIDFNMCTSKKLVFIKNKKHPILKTPMVKEKEIEVFKEVSYPRYIAQNLFEGVLINMGSHLGPRIWSYCTENRSKLLQYATAPFRSFSTLLVKLGLCATPPWETTRNALDKRTINFLCNNPTMLRLFLAYGAQALQHEAYKNPRKPSSAKDPRAEIEEAMIKVDQILELEQKKILLRHHQLKLPNDSEIVTLQAHIDTRLQEVIGTVTKHNLIPKTADLATLMCLNFAGVWSAQMGATLFPSFVKEALSVTEDMCKSAYATVAA